MGSRHGGEDYMLCQIKIMHRFTSNTTADSQSLPASVVVDCLVGRDYSTSANDGQLVQINSAGCSSCPAGTREQIQPSDRPLLESPPPSRGWTRRPPRQPSVASSERTPPSLRSHRPVRRGRRIGAIARARLLVLPPPRQDVNAVAGRVLSHPHPEVSPKAKLAFPRGQEGPVHRSWSLRAPARCYRGSGRSSWKCLPDDTSHL